MLGFSVPRVFLMDIGVMLTKKSSLAAILAVSVTSSLSLYASGGSDEPKNFSISVNKLRDGYKNGEIILESGEKFQVEGYIYPGFLNPVLISWIDEKLFGTPTNGDTFRFVKNFGNREIDPFTGQPDLSKPLNTLLLLDLRLTKIENLESLEKKIASEVNNN